MVVLSHRRLNAIIEALTARLADDPDAYPDGYRKADYEGALDWAIADEARRAERRAARKKI
jgi:hypothetical protein